jgi:Asparagine synthase
LRGFLPDEIITKKKQGFGLPFGVWALRDQRLARWPTTHWPRSPPAGR